MTTMIEQFRNKKDFDLMLKPNGVIQNQTVDNAFDSVTATGGVITTNVNPGFKQPTSEMFLKRVLTNNPFMEDALRVQMPSLQTRMDILDIINVFEFSRNTTGVLGQSKGYADFDKSTIDLKNRILNAVPETAVLDIPEAFVDENLKNTAVLSDISRQIALKVQSGMDKYMYDTLNLTPNSQDEDDLLAYVYSCILDFVEGEVQLSNSVVYLATNIYLLFIAAVENSSANQRYFSIDAQGKATYLKTIPIKEMPCLPANGIMISEKGNAVIGVHGETNIRMLFGFYDDLIGYRSVTKQAFGVNTFIQEATKLYSNSAEFPIPRFNPEVVEAEAGG